MTLVANMLADQTMSCNGDSLPVSVAASIFRIALAGSAAAAMRRLRQLSMIGVRVSRVCDAVRDDYKLLCVYASRDNRFLTRECDEIDVRRVRS